MATTTVGNGSRTVPMAEGDHLVTGPPRRPVSARVPPSLALAVVAGVLAALFYLRGTGGPEGVRVAVAARDIPTGEAVGMGDLRFSEVVASPVLLRQLVPRGDLAALKDSIAARRIVEGSPLLRADLVAPAAGRQQRAMSLPVEREHAVGGALRPGDRVDVIDGAEGSYVVTNAEVLAVPDLSTGTLSGTGDYAITIAVDAQAALRLAAAIAGGKVEVVRSTGADALPPPLAGPIGGRRG
ncbi:MAG: RcpC/CpaB family pilus assembly protein [Actinomycetota bacterium]|nr:RcpC/CpaB family pilus assembly protein [Actinomycetota bacterium]